MNEQGRETIGVDSDPLVLKTIYEFQRAGLTSPAEVHEAFRKMLEATRPNHDTREEVAP